MAAITVAKAKKSIIAKIQKHGGLFENIGQKELRMLQDQNDEVQMSELNAWIESLDCQTIRQYL